MRLAVVGADHLPVTRAIEQLGRLGVQVETVAVPTGASVGDLVEAASGVDGLVGADADAATSLRVPLAAIAARAPAVVGSWPASDHRDHLELDADAREAGIAIVTAASASPALPVILARHGARGLDQVDSVEIDWALPPDALAHPGVGRAVLEGTAEPALIRREGRYSFTRPGRPAPIAFPPPVGLCRTRVFGGAEAWQLPDLLPGRPSLQVRLGGTVPWWPLAVTPAAHLSRSRHGHAPAALLTKGATRLAAGRRGWAALRVEVQGRAGGAAITRVLGGFDHLSTWDTAALTLALYTLHQGLPPGTTVTGATAPPAESLGLLHDLGIRFAALQSAA